MHHLFTEYIFLILIILALVMLANKLKLAYPIVLVLGGLALSFVPFFSHVTIQPDWVFFIFLPPLLYEASWQVSWKEFRKWRRVIMGFAFPVVILTSCVIAVIANAVIPGFTLALGFLLGGIISPPDAVSATTIMRQLSVPKSLMSIIEGESLLNDASSLIVFRFALAAVITGQFHFGEASLDFFLVIVMGTLIGLAVGGVFYAVHRWLPTTASIEIVLTLVTPYCMYFAAEQFHFSGVLAVVAGGLLLSSRRQDILTYRSRIEAANVWTNLVFVLNGLVFLLIGLQLPAITQGLGDTSLTEAISYGVAISVALIIIRMICALGSVYFTKFMSHFITVADANPGLRGPMVFGWAGMRGVVSLAAALSIPLLASEGQAFPYRNLILFITFVVILITLVLQGTTLPWVIKKMKLGDRYSSISQEEQDLIIQKKLAMVSLQELEGKYGGEIAANDYLTNLHARLKIDLNLFEELMGDNHGERKNELDRYQKIYLELLEGRRNLLKKMNRREEFDEDLIRKYLSMADMEEYKIRQKKSEEAVTG